MALLSRTAFNTTNIWYAPCNCRYCSLRKILMETQTLPSSEKFVKCNCCGGLCDWHKEYGPQAESNRSWECNCGNSDIKEAWDISSPNCTPECNSNWSVPNCWGCCGSGCRHCGNTGKISLEKDIEIRHKNILNQSKKIEDLQGDLVNNLRELRELELWLNGGKTPKTLIL